MPYRPESLARRRATGAARSRKHRANLKARLEESTGIPQASRRPHEAPPTHDWDDRSILNVTYHDWAEGRVSYRRLPNPDPLSQVTVILVLTPQRPSKAFPPIESDRLPQSVTLTPGSLYAHWSNSQHDELEAASASTSERSDTPGCP